MARTRRSVARAAIEAAGVEFVRRLREWEHRNDILEDPEEEQEEEEEEETPNIQVEIARAVTPLMVKHPSTAQVPLNEYGDANDLLSPYPHGDTFDYNGHQNHPDGVVLKRVNPRPAPLLPILVVEIEVKYGSIQQLIQVANGYLQRGSVQSVVSFKIFRASKSARVKKPAIVVVFERVPGQVAAPYTVRVAQEISFGSAPIPRHARVSLSELPTQALAADGDNPRVIPRSSCEHVKVDPLNVEASFGLMSPHTLVVPGPDYALALYADRLPKLVFDLRGIFQQALGGWQDDQYDDY